MDAVFSSKIPRRLKYQTELAGQAVLNSYNGFKVLDIIIDTNFITCGFTQITGGSQIRW